MPARPQYFHRLEQALEALRRIESDWIDRRTVEEMLGVSKTVAWRLLRQCGAAEGPGNTLICPRDQAIRALEALKESAAYRQEIRRRNRVEEALARLVRIASAQKTRVVSDSRALALLSSRFLHLPAGVELTAKRLTIEFAGMEDFLEKVGAMVFALQNDYEAIREFIGGSSLPPAPDAGSSSDAV